MKLRKNYNRWIYYKLLDISNNNPKKTTHCGKTSRRVLKTLDISKVTCRRCLTVIEKMHEENQEFSAFTQPNHII